MEVEEVCEIVSGTDKKGEWLIAISHYAGMENL